MKIAIDFVHDGLITKEEAIGRVEPRQLEQLVFIEDLRGTNTRGELEPIGIQFRVRVTVDAEAHRKLAGDLKFSLRRQTGSR